MSYSYTLQLKHYSFSFSPRKGNVVNTVESFLVGEVWIEWANIQRLIMQMTLCFKCSLISISDNKIKDIIESQLSRLTMVKMSFYKYSIFICTVAVLMLVWLIEPGPPFVKCKQKPQAQRIIYNAWKLRSSAELSQSSVGKQAQLALKMETVV